MRHDVAVLRPLPCSTRMSIRVLSMSESLREKGLLGVHSRCGLHTRAVTVFRDTLSEGFSHFVTSIAAPVASGWSVRRVGFAPTGKRRLVTAHGRSGHRPSQARVTAFLRKSLAKAA